MADYDHSQRRPDNGIERRRSRSPDRSRGYRNPELSKMLDPFTMNELVPYSYFCRWYQTLNPGIAVDDHMLNRYEDYITDLTARTAKDFVARQAALPWFLERYTEDPDITNQKRTAVDSFRQRLNNGAFDEFSTTATEEVKGLTMTGKPDSTAPSGDNDPNVLFIKTVPSRLSKAMLTKFIGEKLISGFAVYVSTPESESSARVGWVVLLDNTIAELAIKQIDGLVIDDTNIGRYRLEVVPYQSPAPKAPKRILWSQLSDEAIVEQHLAQLSAIIERKESSITSEPLWATIKARSKEDNVRRLDLGVEYLRIGYYFDYWELQQYGSRFDLEYNSPGYSRLLVPASSDLLSFEAWSSEHTKKFRIFLDPAPYLQLLRQKSVAETVNEQIQSAIRKEEETRYRCQVLDCTKLFKDVPFVQKHIEKRHGAWLDDIRDATELLLRYLADPNKLPPFKEYQEPRALPQDNRTRRRSSPPYRNNGYGGHRGGGRGPPTQHYRDLDRPAEELPELDY